MDICKSLSINDTSRGIRLLFLLYRCVRDQSIFTKNEKYIVNTSIGIFLKKLKEL